MDEKHYLYCFSKNVARLRQTSGLSQKEMAEIMGTSVETLRRLEAGIPTPRMDCCAPLRVSRHFGISLDKLWKEILD